MNLADTIVAKSDQLNSDDLIGGPRTITVRKVTGNDAADQPVNVYFEGDDNKPFRPCKSMRRVLAAVWGLETEPFIGRSMILFRDPNVTWGGAKVGGIRISHMSHIEKPVTLALTETRAKRRPYTVQPLAAAHGASGLSEPDLARLKAEAEAAAGRGKEAFLAWYNSPEVKPTRHHIKDDIPRLQKLVEDVEAQRDVAQTSDDPFAANNLTEEERARIAEEAMAESDSMAAE